LSGERLSTASPGASPSFAVAFGGGGARGLAHIHAIEALDELGIRPTVIAGSSIGAIMGAGTAAGMRGRDIHDYARYVLGSAREVAARMWRARGSTFAQAMQGGLGFAQFDIEAILGAFLPDAVPQRFSDLEIPLKVTATDYFGHMSTVFCEGDLRSALAASAAIPAVFRPVRRDGRVLIDGGIFNPVPFDLLDGAADIVIAIDVVGGPVAGIGRRPNSIDLILGATQLMMQSITAAKLVQRQPEILLRPPVSRFRALDFLKVDAVMAETRALKEELKRAVETAVTARRQLTGG
jgi:NTE family protein